MVLEFLRKIRRKFWDIGQQVKVRQRKNVKIFCIGNNKTGTSSLAYEFKRLGYMVGNQREAELLSKDYHQRKFTKIIKYCKRSEVFQDVPFSWKDTYVHLDKNFPGSKFILTIRDSSEQWYDSLTKFHSKKFGKGELPSVEDLKEVKYVYKGWLWENYVHNYGMKDSDDPYDKEVLIGAYEEHNINVMSYFKNRPNDLLIINLGEKGAYKRFCNFIGVTPEEDDFPWINRTAEIPVKH